MSAFRWTESSLMIVTGLLRHEWHLLNSEGKNPERKEQVWDLICELTVELGHMRGENSAGTVDSFRGRKLPGIVRGAPVDVKGPGWKPIVTDAPRGAGLFLEEAERPE